MFFLQRTFTSLVHAHAGRTQSNKQGLKLVGFSHFVPKFRQPFSACYSGRYAAIKLRLSRIKEYMNENTLKMMKIYLIGSVSFYQFILLFWEHFNGGVVSHHFLQRSDLPVISNWWGVVVLPVLALLTVIRIDKRIKSQPVSSPSSNSFLKSALVSFLLMLSVTICQSFAFHLGYHNITMYLALLVLISGLFLPIYRIECILGYVIGASFVFGAVIPLIGILVIGLISVISNLLVKPIVLRIVRKLSSAHP